MLRRTWIAIPALAAGALLMLLAGAQDTRGAQASLDELAQTDGLTQAEMAVELLRALDGAELAPPDCVPGEETFDDVPASSPFCPFIEELARRGITTGCDDDNFCPGATVTRAQMATSGTQDDVGPGTTPCNTRSGSVQDTGANAGCISDWGVNDMVGNVSEWVADWGPPRPVARAGRLWRVFERRSDVPFRRLGNRSGSRRLPSWWQLLRRQHEPGAVRGRRQRSPVTRHLERRVPRCPLIWNDLCQASTSVECA